MHQTSDLLRVSGLQCKWMSDPNIFMHLFSPLRMEKPIDIVVVYKLLLTCLISHLHICCTTHGKKDLNHLLSKIATSLYVVKKQHVILCTAFADTRMTGQMWKYCYCRWDRNFYSCSNRIVPVWVYYHIDSNSRDK